MDKQKVGILTFQNAHNWGAQMQLYALKEYLEEQGYLVEVINYINRNIESQYPKTALPTIQVHHFKSAVKYGMSLLQMPYRYAAYKRKYEKFNRFIQQLVQDKPKIYEAEEIGKLDLDFIICGSDQIWNPNLTGGLDKAYFANFQTKATKIAYAASMGIRKLPETEEKQFEEYIKQFDYLSVREESLQEYAEKFTDKTIYQVLDPTLLIDIDKYRKIEKKLPYDHYILVYTLAENKILLQMAKKIAKTLGMPILELCYEKKILKIGHKQIADIGPEEFIGLIDQAEFVVTNSFHGTIFSILLEKKFYTVAAKGVNSRIENILKLTDLEDRCIATIEDIHTEDKIDFNKAKSRIQEERKASIHFLKEAMKR